MHNDQQITLFYSPQTRATGARVLLEELGVPYTLRVLNMKVGEQRQPAYLAINPLGKVPAVEVDRTLVTEQGAIYLYLADLFPEAGLAPALTDPDRGAYVRWLFIYGSCFEPAVVDRYMKREPASFNETPYASYDLLIDMLEGALKKGPYLLGDRFTAADLLWGIALHWTTMFGLVEARPAFQAYMERINSRESIQKVSAEDITMAAEHEAAAARMKAAS
ncbi:glutathione S-transferase [Rhizobium sp. Root274]|uniref:glutathione S-transferase family protein n=1 Tax=unclassified Rhizobium TaxID=2613769 RepID=UPI0007150C77|nr:MULTISPECIES: glutathione S-transferase family protein [unclassified Rhizobium]KQW30900.1 glutathione S-transferase [Rhizobium sp. Root1240]KRD32445.1 glutathione S-transferase [Rhizobium sp. Root274]